MKKSKLLIKVIIIMIVIMVKSYSNDEQNLPAGDWKLVEQGREMTMKIQANVVTPLQIITDLDVKATVVDKQKLEIPFKLEMNKNPNKTYKLSYTEKVIDIDNDGKVDVEILSPEYSTSKVIENNKIVIYGDGIKDDGIYRKKIYMTVELKDGI
ncbi:MAG: hypothetical protein ACRC8M_08645 [Cetobacterium sp.]|uniref:hypothetical protein n=1 Tax=Cetobacterium sp. TaxID=2071632 RepID=UPI003F2E105C